MASRRPRTEFNDEIARTWAHCQVYAENAQIAFCLTGLNGAGKTTLARRLVELLGGIHIETGAIARRISADSAETGAYAPEEEFQVAFQDEIVQAQKQAPKPIIIEGFPRYMSQLILAEAVLDRPVYIMLATHPLVCVRRLLARGRQDDTPEYIAKRILGTYEKMDPVYMTIGDKLIQMLSNEDAHIYEMLREVEERLAMEDR